MESQTWSSARLLLQMCEWSKSLLRKAAPGRKSAAFWSPVRGSAGNRRISRSVQTTTSGIEKAARGDGRRSGVGLAESKRSECALQAQGSGIFV